MTYGRLAVRGSLIAAAGFAVTQALTLGAYVLLANVLSPHEFGVFAAGSAFLTIGLLFAESGMHAALVHRNEELDVAADTAFGAAVVAACALALAMVALKSPFGRLLGDPAAGDVMAALAGCVLLRAAAFVPDALLQRRFSFLRRVVVEPLGAFAFAGAAVGAAMHGAGAWALVAGTYASLAVQAVSALAFARWRPRPRRCSFAVWRELIGYGRHVTAAELLRRAASQADVLVVGAFTSLAAAGQYRNGMRLASQPLQGWVNVGAYVLFPAFARLRDDPGRFAQAVLRSLRMVCVAGLPLAFILAAVGRHVATALLGPAWSPAGDVIAALCAYSAGQLLVSLFSETAKAAGATALLWRVHGLSLLLTVPLAAAGASFAGALGAAGAVSLVAIVTGSYALVLTARILGMPWRVLAAEVRAPSSAAVVAPAIVLVADRLLADDELARWHALALAAGESLLALALFGASLALVAPHSLEDFRSAGRRFRTRGSVPAAQEGAIA